MGMEYLLSVDNVEGIEKIDIELNDVSING